MLKFVTPARNKIGKDSGIILSEVMLLYANKQTTHSKTGAGILSVYATNLH